MADLRRQLERSMLVQRVRVGIEVFGKIGDHRGRGAPLLRRAPRRVHHARPTVTLREILVAVPADASG